MSNYPGSYRAENNTLTEEEVEDRRKLEEWAARLQLSVEDVGVFCRHGFYYERIPVEDTPNRRALLAHMKRSEAPPAKWVLVSGLYPECLFTEPERRKRLRALYRVVVLLIKRALARERADPVPERSVFWDPIAEVCRDLEIAQSKLSALCKEFAGHSLSQVVDCVRAEGVKKRLRGKLRGFVREWSAHRATLATEKQGEVSEAVVWKALQGSRKWPGFCRNSWALEFGFSSYRRMYRACLATWQMTPHQMEMAVIGEILREGTTETVEVEEEEGLEGILEKVRKVSAFSWWAVLPLRIRRLRTAPISNSNWSVF